jgi:hypothetical protein
MPITGKTPLRGCASLMLISSITSVISASLFLWPLKGEPAALVLFRQAAALLGMVLSPASALFIEHHKPAVTIAAFLVFSLAYFAAYEGMYRDRIYGYRLAFGLTLANMIAMFVPGPSLTRTVWLIFFSIPLLAMFGFVAWLLWRYPNVPHTKAQVSAGS